jgi:hypothetical protein
MSTKPPVPTDSRPGSEEPPIVEEQGGETLAAIRELAEAKKRRALSRKQIGMGAAIGVGSAAVVAAMLYWRGNKGKE